MELVEDAKDKVTSPQVEELADRLETSAHPALERPFDETPIETVVARGSYGEDGRITLSLYRQVNELPDRHTPRRDYNEWSDEYKERYFVEAEVTDSDGDAGNMSFSTPSFDNARESFVREMAGHGLRNVTIELDPRYDSEETVHTTANLNRIAQFYLDA